MNDIDFIKKCCEYADGFEIIRDSILVVPMGYRTMLNTFINDIQFTSTFYPLLLQRAIEGVNNSNLKWHIVMSKYNEIFINCLDYQLGFGNGDKAKRAALEWIFERMDP